MIKVSEGVSSKGKVCFQIQKFLLKKSATFMQIVDICDVDKATVSKYLADLVEKGTIVLKPKRKQGIEKYTLTTKGKETTKFLLEKQTVKVQIDKMSPEKFQEFKKFLNFINKSKQGDELLLQLQSSNNHDIIKKFKNLGLMNLS